MSSLSSTLFAFFSLFGLTFLVFSSAAFMLSSHAKNSISERTNGQIQKSGMKSGCPESEWFGVGGTWLQLMCCTTLHHCVPNFGRQGLGLRSEIGGWR